MKLPRAVLEVYFFRLFFTLNSRKPDIAADFFIRRWPFICVQYDEQNENKKEKLRYESHQGKINFQNEYRIHISLWYN